MRNEIKKQLREQAENTPATVTTRGAESVSKGGNITVNTNAPTVVIRTSNEPKKSTRVVNITDTSKTYKS
jgi:hypothetical protein